MPTTRITVQNNGSLRIEGDFEVVDADGRVFGLAGRTRVTLCRCGQSKDKPFCDSTHKTCGFESVVIARDLPPPKVAPAAPTQPQSPPTPNAPAP
jgi:CDGSH-type Zn-finger protein